MIRCRCARPVDIEGLSQRQKNLSHEIPSELNGNAGRGAQYWMFWKVEELAARPTTLLSTTARHRGIRAHDTSQRTGPIARRASCRKYREKMVT